MRIIWDAVGERYYETGVNQGVLYVREIEGSEIPYSHGVPWNGLVSINENPTGAESNKKYADNIAYLNLISAEEFEATVEAYTYPPEFERCDGSAELVPGVFVGQQRRSVFGMSYRTNIGNDVDAEDHGYKLHLIYGANASTSDKSYETINETPEAITMSWDITTTPVAVPGLKPSATLIIDSRTVDADGLLALEEVLYGSSNKEPRLPLPEEVMALVGGGSGKISVTPQTPTFNPLTGIVTIPDQAGVIYMIGDTVLYDGPQDPLDPDNPTAVVATPDEGYKFPVGSATSWVFTYQS